MTDDRTEAALHALMSYQQADEDGVMVLVSRQAIHEVAEDHQRLTAENERLKGEIEERIAKFENELDAEWRRADTAEAERDRLREALKNIQIRASECRTKPSYEVEGETMRIDDLARAALKGESHDR